MPGTTPDYAIDDVREPPRRAALYLALVRNPRDEDGLFVREMLAKLYDYATEEEGFECSDTDYAGESELRIRDIDGDGEVEAQVVAAVGAVLARTRAGTVGQECGRVAFLVGADMRVQAQFTREYHSAKVDAGGETFLSMETRWRLEDQNDDRHADLRVIESYTYQDDFDGDYAGEDYGTVPGEHHRGSGRRSVDCPYDVAADVWACPATPSVGRQFFRSRAELDLPSRGVVEPGW